MIYWALSFARLYIYQDMPDLIFIHNLLPLGQFLLCILYLFVGLVAHDSLDPTRT